MHDQLLAYLCCALELDEVSRVEAYLKGDREAQRRFELLRLGLAPLEGDRAHVEAPRGLARRTCLRIRELRP